MSSNKLLIDTHVLIWLANGSNIGPETLELIKGANNVYVSAISILELRIKCALGKLPEAEAIISSIEEMDLEVLPFDQDQSKIFRIFNEVNRDPFDNTLISISIDQGITLVTANHGILNVKISKLKCIDAQK